MPPARVCLMWQTMNTVKGVLGEVVDNGIEGSIECSESNRQKQRLTVALYEGTGELAHFIFFSFALFLILRICQ